jgi:hypothetical protein
MARLFWTVITLTLGLGLGLVVLPGVAFAETGSVAVIVSGGGAAKVETTISASLPAGLSATSATAGEAKAGKKLAAKKGRSKAVAAVAKAAKQAGHAAAVVGTVKKKKVALVVIDADSGQMLLDETVAVDDAGVRVAEALAPVAERFSQDQAVVEVSEGPGEGEGGSAGGGEGDPGGDGGAGEGGGEGDGAVKASATGAKAKGPMIEAGGGIIVGGRSMGYGGTTSGDLGDYSLFGAFLVDLGGTFYPLPRKPGLLGGAGVSVGFRQSLGLSSSTSGGTDLGTSWRELTVGARLRFGGANKFVAAALAWGSTSFDIDEPAGDGKLYPSASYSYLRVGGDGRYPVTDKIAAYGSFGLRIVVGVSGFSDGFGDASAFGIDFGVGASYRLTRSIEAKAGFGLERYGTSLSGGTTYMADGASDVLYGFNLGAAWAM